MSKIRRDYSEAIEAQPVLTRRMIIDAKDEAHSFTQSRSVVRVDYVINHGLTHDDLVRMIEQHGSVS